MAKFVINPRSTKNQREVEADFFQTVGDFIDFYRGGSSYDDVVLRIKSEHVTVIERVEQ